MPASIPNLHVSTKSKVTGSAIVSISSRREAAAHEGRFKVTADNIVFDPASNDYPAGEVRIDVDLSDSAKAIFISTSIELINSFGKHNPTIVFTGRCNVDLQEQGREPIGCKYWVIIANNKSDNQGGTPDIVGFVITDRTGRRIAYGTGPVTEGDLEVIATGQ